MRSRIEILPEGPSWSYKTVPMFVATKEPVILYYEDPIDCLKAIFSNPLFQDHLELIPYCVYKSADRKVCNYNEWMSGDAAWHIQVSFDFTWQQDDKTYFCLDGTSPWWHAYRGNLVLR